jgi:hypothetical protein
MSKILKYKKTRTMKKLSKTILSLALILTVLSNVQGQNRAIELPWQNPTAPTASGTSVTPQTATFYLDDANYTAITAANFTTDNTPLNVTVGLRNQVYTGLNYGACNTGLSFGTQKSEWDDPTILTQAPTPGPFYTLIGANVTLGPDVDVFKTRPSALINTIDPTGNQFGNDGNGGFPIFSTVEVLQDLGASATGRYEYGELVITFSRPVKDPVIHIASLGGASWYDPLDAIPNNWRMSYFSTELELQTPGYTSQRLSGTPFFNVVGNNILNSSDRPNSSSTTGGFDKLGFSTFGAATGSILVKGIVTELVYKVYVRGSANSQFNFSFNRDQTTTVPGRDPFYGDYWSISFSKEKGKQEISGNVFNDRDGLNDNNVNQSVGAANPRTNVSGLLYANLIRNGVVVDTIPVSADGRFLFDNVDVSGANSYTVQLTTIKGTIGSSPPATTLPAGWVNTGENGSHIILGSGTGNDGTVNGISAPITVVPNDIIPEINFGIERLPESVDFTRVIPSPSIGTVMTLSPLSNLPVLTGSDPEDQPVSGSLANKSILFTTVPNNATLRYNGAVITAGTTISGYNPNLLTITFNGPAQAFAQFNYAYVDASGRPDPTPALYKLVWSGGPLAITLTDFTAVKNNCIAGLTWKTASEINASRFEIEVSNSTSAVYNKVGSVNATAANGKTYQFGYPMQAGIQYYFRLKMIDKDGSFKYSDVRPLSCDGKSTGITIAPNPVIDQFVISGMENGKNTIVVFAANGQQVKTQIIPQAQGYVNIGNLASGMYSVKIISEKGNVTVGKLIKN